MIDQTTQAAQFAALANSTDSHLPVLALAAVPVHDHTPGRVTVALTRAARWAGRKLAALWRMLPGPWWVKVALLALCLAIPGPGDEIALLAVTGFLAVRKAKRARARAQVAR